MGKNATFNLGPSVGLSARQLTVSPDPGAGDTIPTTAVFDQDVGLVEIADVNGLSDNTMFRAVLSDTVADGTIRPPQKLAFNTGSLQYLGPEASSPNTSEFYLLHMEDLSSSSSLSSSSASTSSSSSNSSSSSPSSSSPSSSSSSSSSSSQS